jgi:hypothetical protein
MEGKTSKRHEFALMKHENIFHDRNEGIPNSIMRCNPFPIMGTKKNVGPY